MSRDDPPALVVKPNLSWALCTASSRLSLVPPGICGSVAEVSEPNREGSKGGEGAADSEHWRAHRCQRSAKGVQALQDGGGRLRGEGSQLQRKVRQRSCWKVGQARSMSLGAAFNEVAGVCKGSKIR